MQKRAKMESNQLVHIGFEIGLLFKGIDGALEIIGGILLIFLNPDRLNRLIRMVTQVELSEDPKDFVANALLHLSKSFSLDTQYFGIIYLMAHGIIKLLIIALLWKKNLWAYPIGIVTFILFIIYQLYRYSIHPSIWMVLLTLFDLVMIVLTVLEYHNRKNALSKST